MLIGYIRTRVQPLPKGLRHNKQMFLLLSHYLILCIVDIYEVLDSELCLEM